MSAREPLLKVDGLTVEFATLRHRLKVLEDVSLTVHPGEIVGLVGESGSGKSVTAMSVMGLLPDIARVAGGSIGFDGAELTGLSRKAMREMRGRDMAMIFQEPMTSLNPVHTVSFQIGEVLVEHFGATPAQAHAKAVELMAAVGIPDAARRALDYPHQLSGGMRQRVMIAMAVACQPKLLLADEPTTALDVTIQAQILDLMRSLRDQFNMAILMITHDLGVIAQMAERVVVMYAGQVVEEGTAAQIFDQPAHPYTRLLIRSIPSARHKSARLDAIPGSTPSAHAFPQGCRFHPRCPEAVDRCRTETQALHALPEGRSSRCWRSLEALQDAVAAS
ncbi:MAG: ABC transporter ATP-binding protein [Pseudomonadota bacterium]